MGEAYEQVEVPAFAAPVVFLHVRIPACGSAGHKADYWGVDKPDVTCSLRCVNRGDTFVLRLYELNSEEVFAEAVWPPDRPMSSVFDAATDSSRYWAVRIEDAESKKHTFIGLGFGERERASEFKAALLEHQSYLQRMREAAETRKKTEAQPALDMSLKQPSITIRLPTNPTRKGGLMSRMQAAPNLFAVPPVGAVTGAAAHPRPLGEAPASIAAPAEYKDDEFGDFQS